MARVRVEFEVEVPVADATGDQIEEWLRFMLHDNGSIENKNPLSDREVEPIFGTFIWHRK